MSKTKKIKYTTIPFENCDSVFSEDECIIENQADISSIQEHAHDILINSLGTIIANLRLGYNTRVNTFTVYT